MLALALKGRRPNDDGHVLNVPAFTKHQDADDGVDWAVTFIDPAANRPGSVEIPLGYLTAAVGVDDQQPLLAVVSRPELCRILDPEVVANVVSFSGAVEHDEEDRLLIERLELLPVSFQRSTPAVRQPSYLTLATSDRASLRPTGRSRVGMQLPETIAQLNLFLRGWGYYFRTGNAAGKFVEMDRYVAWRLKRLLVKKRGRNLRAGQADRWTRTWFRDQGLHQLMGTIRYPTAA